MSFNPNSLTKDQLAQKLCDIAEELEDLQLPYEKAKHHYNYLNHSDVIKVVMDSQYVLAKGSSIKDREALARTSDVFKQHIDAIKEASDEYVSLKAKYESTLRFYELLEKIFLKRTS